MNVKERLFELQNLTYRDFHSKLMPTVEKKKIIGVKIPNIRKLAKQIANTPDACEFMSSLPHEYYEENNLHAFLIAELKDFDNCIFELERFLPFVDNWATCDSLRPKCFKFNTDRLLECIYRWISSDKPYTVRFGIEMLMLYYLEDNFDEKYLKLVAEVRSDEYYVNMMIAWYFATALAKQYEATLPYIETKKLSIWIHNKTIQKACESYRITDDKKVFLRTFKAKI